MAPGFSQQSALRMCGLLRRDSRQTLMVVGLGGLEPPASPLSGVRSNHLSYRPNSRSMPCTAIFAVSDACAWIQVPCVGVLQGRSCSKGGDPAAPSDTATLLRLHPSH